jgi:hypothetical protein
VSRAVSVVSALYVEPPRTAGVTDNPRPPALTAHSRDAADRVGFGKWNVRVGRTLVPLGLLSIWEFSDSVHTIGKHWSLELGSV